MCGCVHGHLQHEVLLPAWFVSSHRDGGALDILHLQRHVGVILIWNTDEDRVMQTHTY